MFLGVADGPVYLQRGAGRIAGRPVTQEGLAALEDRRELPEAEDVGACGCELDGERQALDAPRDLGGERPRCLCARDRTEGWRRPRITSPVNPTWMN